MTFITNLTLRQRLLGSFALVAGVTILSGVSGIVSLLRIGRNVQTTSSQVSRIVDQQTVQTNRVIRLSDAVYRIDVAVTHEDLREIRRARDIGVTTSDVQDPGQPKHLERLSDAKEAEITAREALSRLDEEFGRRLDDLNTAMSAALVSLSPLDDLAAGPSTPDRIMGSPAEPASGVPLDGFVGSLTSRGEVVPAGVAQILTVRAWVLELNLAIRRLLLAENPVEVDLYQSKVEHLYDRATDQVHRMGSEQDIGSVMEHIVALRANTPRLAEAKTRHLVCTEAFDKTSREVFNEVQKLSTAVVAVVNHLDASVHDQFAVSYLHARSLMALFVGVSVVAFSLSIGVGIRLARSFSASISRVVSQAKDVADGDLTHSISLRGNDEIGVLANHFNVMLRNLKEMLGRVQDTALQITSTGQEIQVINEAQTTGAMRQSSAVSQTTAAAAQLSHTSEQIGRNIKTISHMANHVLAGMEKIKQATDQTNRILLSLNEKSKQIGNITELIDDVADQTNLLAVNASIEAARAGEQGRGFTVVADQIGKLADSTAKSTKDITSLIEMIQHEMANAIVAMEQSLSGVEEEIQFAKDSATKSQEIAVSANEQINGSRQIAEAMAGIDQTMKDIVSGATRSAESAELLTGLADDLKKSMSRFKVNEHDADRRARHDSR